jgi:hypothetical protein
MDGIRWVTPRESDQGQRADIRPVGGFVTLWALNYVTLIAAGWAIETMLAVLGLPWLPFFLILWIIREFR